MTRRNVLFLRLLGLLVLALAAGQSTWAGTELTHACYPDCEGDKWDAVHYHEMTLPGGCRVSVSYAKRFACGRWFDVHIFRVDYVDPDDPACAGLKTETIAKVLELTTEQLLQENPMGFPPPSTGVPPTTKQCNTNWRVIKGACWSKIPTDIVAEHYYSCSVTACCLKPYTVCLDPCGNRTVQKGSWGSSGSCSGSVPPEGGGPCEPVCG